MKFLTDVTTALLKNQMNQHADYEAVLYKYLTKKPPSEQD